MAMIVVTRYIGATVSLYTGAWRYRSVKAGINRQKWHLALKFVIKTLLLPSWRYASMGCHYVTSFTENVADLALYMKFNFKIITTFVKNRSFSRYIGSKLSRFRALGDIDP